MFTPGSGSVHESSRLAECIGDTRDLLKKILVDSYRQISLPAPANHLDFQANQLDGSSPTDITQSPILGNYSPPMLSPAHTPLTAESTLDNAPSESRFGALARAIIDECHETFVACFHAFYPSTHLKWNCLCDLLNLLEPVNAYLNQIMLLSY